MDNEEEYDDLCQNKLRVDVLSSLRESVREITESEEFEGLVSEQ